ncbi:hypothetical protein C7974DRAFT_302569, partial [Boeremia exigua]|uniref:uncharacterized protein n=1 Tax=Boeremia exigua TaxID=749465 RepID=UPI001E8D5F92
SAMDQYTPEELDVLRAQDQGPLCQRIIITFTSIAFISICLRVYTRMKYHKTGWEDWTIMIAMVRCCLLSTYPQALMIITCVCQLLQIRAGSGKHAMFVPYPEKVSEGLKYLFFSIIAYNMSLTATKISILLQYYRIFTIRELRVPVYVALAIVGSWGVVLLFTSIFSCVPVEAYWNVLIKGSSKCVDQMALWYVNASANMITDLMVAVIPVRGIWSLQIPKRQKLALLAILTIGWFVCVVSIIRVTTLTVFEKHMDDATYYSAPTAYWSSIEANLGIVCASLPALKPLIVRIIPVFGSLHDSRGRTSDSATGNRHRLHKLVSKGIRRTGDDEEKLTSQSSVSHAHSFTSGPSESEMQGKKIYVTKQFEVDNSQERQGSNQEVAAAEFLTHDTSR